jgi:hypothetical protein
VGSSGDNFCIGTISLAFPVPQPEVWIRWYERYESGFEWIKGYINTKELYFKVKDGTGTTRNADAVGFYGIDRMRDYTYASANVPIDLTQWIDNFAYGSTDRIYPFSITEISGDGGSTWKYQPPTVLSDTLIAVIAELPTKTASNYLLRVTNNQQQTSSTFNLSGTADTTAPSAPSGLGVS